MAPNPSSLTRAQYAGLDFDTHLDDLRARLQTKYAQDYNDFATSALGMMLMDLAAFGLDTLSFYLDRRATDTYISTARTRRAVAKLARQLGYKMGAAVASSTDLQVTIPNTYPFNVTIPKGFKWKGPNQLVFETAEDVLWASNDTIRTKTVPVYEGETVNETFVSDGNPHQTFELRRVPSNKFIVGGTVKVLVAGTPYDESAFLTFDETAQFEIGYNDDPPTLRFGDGVAGLIPPTAASVICSYVASRGRAGLVNKNTIKKELNPLVVNFQAVSITVTNPEASIGGEDPEDLVHAKVFAPKVWKSRDVAVTGEDYDALAGSFADPLFGRVAAARAISARSAMEDTELLGYLFENTAVSPTGASIQNIVDTAVPVAGVGGTATTALRAGLASTVTHLGFIAGAGDAIVTKVSTATGNIDTIITGVRGAKNSSLEATTDAGSASSNIAQATSDPTNGVTALRTKISGLAGGAADSSAEKLQDTTKSALLSALDWMESTLDRAKAQSDTAASSASAIQITLDNQLRQIGSVKDGVTAIGTKSGSVYAGDVAAVMTRTQSIANTVGTPPILPVTPPGTTLYENVAVIETQVTTAKTATLEQCNNILAHVDQILASDGKANLVVVPILARDAAGFFTQPSVGLIRSLQNFLDARKEVTQTVSVVDGSNNLVRVLVITRAGVLRGFSESVTKTAIVAAIEAVLRERKFGVSLYISDLSDAIKAVDGVGFCNISIRYEGMPALVDGGGNPVEDVNGNPEPDMAAFGMKLDTTGNLILAANEVITKSDVQVYVEAAPVT